MSMTRMSNKGDDCYFYYYSTCTKGDACPFRHCEAAMGNETVCSLWQDNRCFRNVCKFRHMEIDKNRKEIPCYWENQPGGCQKFNCAFHHEKPRLIDGHLVAPDEGPMLRKENEETTPEADQVSSASANVSTNPQLRGVIKVEAQESVPSPTHPPVVINPVDDEDDEDVDQFSEEGEEVSGVSPKKLLTSSRDSSLDFGVKSLEEIRLGKALNASLNRAGLDCFSSTKQHSNRTGTEKTTAQSHSQAAVGSPSDIMSLAENLSLLGSRKRKISERLGKGFDDGGIRLKGSLAKRLGGFVDSAENITSTCLENVQSLRPVRERLGITTNIAAPKSPNIEPKPTDEIRIKTLEEIRQEKAAKSLTQGKDVIVKVLTKESTATKSVSKPLSGHSVKTFSETLHEKKKCQETKLISQQSNTSTETIEGPRNSRKIKVTTQSSEVRVKTLEEIRKEKATRMQANPQDITNEDLPSSGETVSKRQMLCVGKIGSVNIRTQKVKDCKLVDCTEDTAEKGASIQDVTVKSFEEIMREKRLRKQQEHAASVVVTDQSDQKTTPLLCKNKLSAGSSPGIRIQANSAIQQDISQQTSSPKSSLEPHKTSPEKQNKENSLKTGLKKCKTSTLAALPVPETETYCDNVQAFTKSSCKATELRVRPKLNVKPSVIKPANREKPGQKRKATGSAVAAVKPLNNNPASCDEPTEKQIQLSVPSSSFEIESRLPQVSSPEQCSPKPFSASQSPVIRNSTQSGPRRASLSSARSSAPAGNSSAVDDLEDLLDEFTDDRIEDEIELDPGKGEDDLLLELSKMIDS